MSALVRRGHFPETPDGFRDAVTAALDITAVWRESNGGPTAVAIAVGRAVHPRYVGWTEADTDCFHRDQDAVWEALRTDVTPPA
jgi:hypothetical protein